MRGMPPNPNSMRQRILALLEDAGRRMTTEEIAAELQADRKKVKHAVNSLLSDKLVRAIHPPVRYLPFDAPDEGDAAPQPAAVSLPLRPRGPFDV